MTTKSKNAFLFAVILGAASVIGAAAQAQQGDAKGQKPRGNTAHNYSGIYAQEPSSPTQPTGTRSPTSFEKSWFDYQSHDDR
jgi:hypothetical protein